MSPSVEQIFIDIFLGKARDSSKKINVKAYEKYILGLNIKLSSEDLANLYCTSAFLLTAYQYIKEIHWVKKKENIDKPFVFSNFIKPFLENELNDQMFLHQILISSSLEDIKENFKELLALEKAAINLILEKPFGLQKKILKTSLKLVSSFFSKEFSEKSSLSLFRTFDNLDKILGLNYETQIITQSEQDSSERLYLGAGCGVQSEYSTIFSALSKLNLGENSKVVDLGSGYGRIGYIIGLTRPDIYFEGYEFVNERVLLSQQITNNFELGNTVKFFSQDLSDKNFIIPIADVYYMYDPFTEETYKLILAQLVLISRKQKVFIVTKGNARLWLKASEQQESNWTELVQLHGGNLCIFSSGTSL